jgi:predicted Zn-dependent peptidase
VNIPTTLPQPQSKIELRAHQLTSQAIGYRLLSQSITGANDLLAVEMLGYLAASGKLLEELRDKQGMVADLMVQPEVRLASGAFFAQFETLPGNEQRAGETAQAELQRLAAAPPSDDEFEQGRNATIGRYAIALQSHPERSLEYARAVIFGRKPSDVETQPDFIRSVKKADIKRLAENVIKANQAGRGVVRGEKKN